MAPATPGAELALVKTWLVDTGPLVASLVADDPARTELVSHLDQFTVRLATTSAVITETMHFVARLPQTLVSCRVL